MSVFLVSTEETHRLLTNHGKKQFVSNIVGSNIYRWQAVSANYYRHEEADGQDTVRFSSVMRFYLGIPTARTISISLYVCSDMRVYNIYIYIILQNHII